MREPATATLSVLPWPTIGDLDDLVEQVEGVGRDAMLLMPEHRDGWYVGGRQIGEADCFVGQFNANDAGS